MMLTASRSIWRVIDRIKNSWYQQVSQASRLIRSILCHAIMVNDQQVPKMLVRAYQTTIFLPGDEMRIICHIEGVFSFKNGSPSRKKLICKWHSTFKATRFNRSYVCLHFTPKAMPWWINLDIIWSVSTNLGVWLRNARRRWRPNKHGVVLSKEENKWFYISNRFLPNNWIREDERLHQHRTQS